MLKGYRSSDRLQGYDYAQSGAYFVTICTHQRLHLFGQVVDDAMTLSGIGMIVQTEWLQTAVVRRSIELDDFVVMPNHMHGIIAINDNLLVGYTEPTPTLSKRGVTPNNVVSNSLGAVVRGFKAAVSRQIGRSLDPLNHPVWQRNYHDHIIRDENDLNRIRDYILRNPTRWREDRFFT